jgi:hypothetical protein
MSRLFPALVGLVLIVAGGLAHGWWTDRWGLSNEPAASAAKLDNVARNVGDWEATDDRIIGAPELAIGEITNYLSRAYKNRVSGQTVTVLMVCGRPGSISVHTPDVCFRGAGQELLDMKRQQLNLGDSQPSIECFVAHFRQGEAERATHTRVFWTWSADGVWQAPSSPRIAFAGYRALYKLYVLRPVLRNDEPFDTDPAVDFLKVFIPELRKTLFGKADPTAVP